VGGIYTETWSSRLGIRRKGNDLAKSKDVKTGCNVAEHSEEGCGLKKGCFANGGGGDVDGSMYHAKSTNAFLSLCHVKADGIYKCHCACNY
jgi:hypothetical protein